MEDLWFVISKELESETVLKTIFHLLYFPIFANSVISYTDRKMHATPMGVSWDSRKKTNPDFACYQPYRSSVRSSLPSRRS